MIGKTIKELNIGDTAEFSKTISESDVYLYAGITGDFNPAHVDELYAEKTFFKTRIAHGLLSAGLISTVMGTILPGPGTIYLHQDLNFLTPVAIGDTITAQVKIAKIETERNRVYIKTECINQYGVKVIDGMAIVSPPKSKEI